MSARDLLLEKLARLADELELTDIDWTAKCSLDGILKELKDIASTA